MLAGIYLHIPFCLRKCPYCDFYSVTDLGAVPRFVDALITEIHRAADQSGQDDRMYDSIYFCGGTPCLLDIRDMDRVLSTLYSAFSISPDTEITLEVNPGSFDTDHPAAWRRDRKSVV